MIQTEKLRKQHEDLNEQIRIIKKLMVVDKLMIDPNEVLDKMTSL